MALGEKRNHPPSGENRLADPPSGEQVPCNCSIRRNRARRSRNALLRDKGEQCALRKNDVVPMFTWGPCRGSDASRTFSAQAQAVRGAEPFAMGPQKRNHPRRARARGEGHGSARRSDS